jgi:CDP-glucose 4,6-dehydratase
VERGQGTLEGLGVNPDFWRDRRVLVTGHTGFKGSWLVLWLSRLGANVVGYALSPPAGLNLFDLAKVAPHLHSVFADVRDLVRMKRELHEFQPEIVFHLAAQSLVLESYRSPIDTLETNIIGTANLLEAVRGTQSVRAVVVVTSDKCYENVEKDSGYRETDPMGGHDPYSCSKGAAELVTASYRRSFFHLPDAAAIATVRAGNVIGGGDFAVDRLIPDCVRAIERGQPLAVRNPDSTRPWQFVLEPLGGYLTLAERLVDGGHAYAEAWNFGPLDNPARAVRWLCDRFAAALTPRSRDRLQFEWAPDPSARHESKYLRLDISKAGQRLDWHPTLAMEDAVSMTASWYGQYLDDGNLPGVTLDQIDRYQRRFEQSPASQA